jgi:hypothetical protein
MSQNSNPDFTTSSTGQTPEGTPGYPASPGQATPPVDYFESDTPPYPASGAATGSVSTDPYYPEPVSYESSTTDSSTTKDVAKDEAANVKDTAVGAGQQVASVAKDEAKNVVADAGQQAKSLLNQAAGEASSQVNTQQQRIASLVQGYAKELSGMSSGESTSGALTDLVSQASQKVTDLGQWLENREPKEVLNELSSFARRRPGAFLLGAALAGAAAGRLTKGLMADAKDSKSDASLTTGREFSSPSGTAPMGDAYYGDSAAPAYAEGSSFSDYGRQDVAR